MKTITIFFCSLFMAAMVQGQIIYVPADFSTIQLGINAATPGDTVLVAEGTYYGQINFLGKKPLTVASEFLMDGDTSHISKTIIDGSQLTNLDSASVVYFISGEDTTSVLCGFTIQGGKGTFWNVWESFGGGGIFITNSTATIRNNIIQNNFLNDTLSSSSLGCVGAGIHASYGVPGWTVIENNKIAYNISLTNHSWSEGGGMYVYGTHARIKNNVVANNISKNTGIGHGTAGGIVCEADTVLIQTIIRDNLIENNEARATEYGYGGGICLWWLADNSIIANNKFINNKNDWNGGGLDLFSNNFTTFKIENNYFIGNEAMNGGAIDVDYDSTSQIILLNNVFAQNTAKNQGGAIWLNRSNVCPVEHMLISVNNSFYNNTAAEIGGAIYSYEDNPMILNTIFWQNPDMSGNEIAVESGYSEIAFCDIDTTKISGDKIVGVGVITQDPVFKDFFTLMTEPWSPCVDAGAASFTCNCGDTFLATLSDITGVPRPVGGGYDMGAYDITYSGEGIRNTAAALPFSVWPNPFNISTNFSYNLAEPSQAKICVYDNFGWLVAEPVNAFQQKGEQQILWNAGNLQAGIYFYRIVTDTRQITGKMILVK